MSLVASAAGQEEGLGAAEHAPCPSDSEVKAELLRLGAAPDLNPAITFVGDRMQVQLRGRDGIPIGSREVEAPATCRERATAAAVFVAAWTGLWPEGPKMENKNPLTAQGAPSSAPPPSAKSPASIVPAATTPSASPLASALPTPTPASTPPPSVRTAAASHSVHHPRKTEIGLAIMGAYDGNASAVAAALELRRWLAGSVLGFVGLTGTSERERSVGSAVGGYTFPALEAGAALGAERGRLRGELGLSARLGILIVRGKDLPSTHVKARAVSGMAATLRLVRIGERFSPFATVASSWWIGRRTLALDNDAATADLPGWDAQVGLGVLWAL
ncbi:MAG TPA: hypothetical protein VF550_19255 [Polyangia bacterium]